MRDPSTFDADLPTIQDIARDYSRFLDDKTPDFSPIVAAGMVTGLLSGMSNASNITLQSPSQLQFFIEPDGSTVITASLLNGDQRILRIGSQGTQDYATSEELLGAEGEQLALQLRLDDGKILKWTADEGATVELPDEAAPLPVTPVDLDVHAAPPTAGSTPPEPTTSRPILSAAEIGAVFGSALSQMMGIRSPVGRVLADSALSTILGELGASLDQFFADSAAAGSTAATPSFTAAIDGSLDQIQAGLGSAFVAKGVGALSSFLTAELGEALGVNPKSFGGQLFSVVGSSATTALLDNVVANLSTGQADLFAGIGGDAFATGLAGRRPRPLRRRRGCRRVRTRSIFLLARAGKSSKLSVAGRRQAVSRSI